MLSATAPAWPSHNQAPTTPRSAISRPITLFNGLSSTPPGNAQTRRVYSAQRTLPQHTNRQVSQPFIQHWRCLVLIHAEHCRVPGGFCFSAPEKEMHDCIITLRRESSVSQEHFT